MFILSRGGQTYARLRLVAGIGLELIIPVAVDYSRPFAGSDHLAWDQEYQACVRRARVLRLKTAAALPGPGIESPIPVSAASHSAGDDWWLDQNPDSSEETSYYDR
jgi:hypothetical protein